MKGSPKHIILGAHSEVRAALKDLCTLLRILASRPNHVRELVPDMPHYVGYHNAAAEGAGGVWFSFMDNMPPVVWQAAFLHDVASKVVSDGNPEGRLTNSNLKLAAEVMAVGIALAVAPTVKHVLLGTLCDNTPTVSWIEKMASKAKGPMAGRLLRGLVVMLHCNKAGQLTTVHVPGVDNVMADVASCPAKAQKMSCATTSLSDTNFCSSFNTTFPSPQWPGLDACRGPPMAEIVHLRNIAWEAIGTATVDRTKCNHYWRAWTAHCQLYPKELGSRLTASETTDRLLTFAVTVREGQYGLGSQVKVQSVEQALRYVAQRLVLDGHPDLRQASPAQHALDLPIAWLIKKFRDGDLPAQPKHAIPISTITALSKNYRMTPHLEAVMDLVLIVFFYLLQVGEYTTPHSTRTKKIIPLWDCDIRLWYRGKIILHSTGLQALMQADSATICIMHTKNGTKGAVVHHEAIGGPICPVVAMARHIANIQQAKLVTCQLNAVYNESGQRSQVLDRDIRIAVRWGATCDCLLTRGYTMNRILSHSLRAGGAMAMKLSGASDSTIMGVGRWSSLTYLTYIHLQISALTAGLSKLMATQVRFQNVG